MPLRPRKTRWTVIERSQGFVDILRGGKAFAYDVDTITVAISRIKRSSKFKKGDEILVIDKDDHKVWLRP